MAQEMQTKAKFKRTDAGYAIGVMIPRTVTIPVSQLPLAFEDFGLTSNGEVETQILQLAVGEDLILDVTVDVERDLWVTKLKQS